MWGSFNAVKTVKWRAFIKKLHYFTANFARAIEKYIKAML